MTFDRSSNGLSGLVGVRAELPVAGLTGLAGFGVDYRQYDARFFGEDTSPAVLFRLDYRPRDTGFRLRAQMDSGIRETDLLTASGFTEYRYRIDATQELGGGFELGAGFDYRIRDFEIVQAGVADRTDRLLGVDARLLKTFYQDFFAELALGYERRDSDQVTAEYDGVTVGVTLGARFD